MGRKWSIHGPHLHSKWSILSVLTTGTTFSVYLIEYCLAPPTDVLCIGSGSEAGYFPPVRLVHSILIFFFKFQF